MYSSICEPINKKQTKGRFKNALFCLCHPAHIPIAAALTGKNFFLFLNKCIYIKNIYFPLLIYCKTEASWPVVHNGEGLLTILKAEAINFSLSLLHTACQFSHDLLGLCTLWNFPSSLNLVKVGQQIQKVFGGKEDRTQALSQRSLISLWSYDENIECQSKNRRSPRAGAVYKTTVKYSQERLTFFKQTYPL